MKGKTCVVSGHSGAGKSTLINAIAPNLHLKTAEISQQHQQGQHTTTFAEMFDLPFGARIIDTPGIKGFGMVEIEKEELTDYFPEFFALKHQCKFNNCLHTDEPEKAKESNAKNNIKIKHLPLTNNRPPIGGLFSFVLFLCKCPL